MNETFPVVDWFFAMSGPSSRYAEWSCAAIAVCLLAACTDGVSTPLVLRDGAAADGGDVEEPVTQTSPGRIEDAGDPKGACKALQDSWPSDYSYEEMKLVEHFNKLRMSPGSVCGRGYPPAGPLEINADVTCLARLRLRAEMPARTGSSPSFFVPDLFSERESADLGGRLEKTDLDFEDLRALGELVITNATTAQSIADAFMDQPFSICPTANPGFKLVGVARSGHAWVVSFASLWNFPGRPGPGGR